MSPSSLDTLALSDYFQDVDDRQDAVSRKRKHDSEEWPSAGGDNPLLSSGPLDDDFVASILSLLQVDKCSSDVEDFAINHQNGPEDDSMQQLFAIMHQLNARAPLSASSANAPIDQPLIASQESRPLRRRKTVPDNLPTTDFCAPPSSVIPDHQENAMMDTDWFLLGTNDVPLSPTLTSPSASSSSSSSILSPPISPIQPGELLLSAPPSQDEQAEDWMPLVKQYLSAESSGLMLSGERTVIILTGKVAQKSYGTEKRFLSPPPTTLLLGPWQQPNGLLIRIGTENSQPIAGSHPVSGTLEWFDAETGRLATPFFHHYSSAYGKCVAKHLHITDAAEKRRQVQVLLDLQLGGQSLGVLPSRNIKVISKPSKKKQSKHLEHCIHHGSTIALFNRIRSQTVSTKYLGVQLSSGSPDKQLEFTARAGSWDPFFIWTVQKNSAGEWVHQDSSNNLQQQPIRYNQHIVLQCVQTGRTSPVLIVRPIDRTRNPDDPVSQLHRVAFELESKHDTFLSCIKDTVGMHDRTFLWHQEDRRKRLEIVDAAIWTVIGTECATYTFWTPPTSLPFGPFPITQEFSVKDSNTFVLTGSHLLGLSVWLGNVRATILCSEPNKIVGHIPPIQDLLMSPVLVIQDEWKTLPISLVRESNGTVYRTNHIYSF